MNPMANQKELDLLSARLDEDAYIELVGAEVEESLPPRMGTRRDGA